MDLLKDIGSVIGQMILALALFAALGFTIYVVKYGITIKPVIQSGPEPKEKK